MDNQHRKLDGYGELNQVQIDMMNEIAAVGRTLKELTDRIADDKALPRAPDRRWLSIGVTDLQKGLMAVKRSIAQPSGF